MALEDLLHPLLARYGAAPQWLRAGIGSVYGALPTRWRHGPAFDAFRADAAARWPREVVAREVDKRLVITLNEALNHVPAYAAFRPLLAQGLPPRQLLAQLPLTSKADIKRDTLAYLSKRWPPSQRLDMFTGGSTAEPMRLFFHKHVTRPKETAYYLDLDARACWQQGSLILNLRGRNVRGAGRDGAAPWSFDPIRRHLILSSDHLEARFMPGYVQTLREWKPTIIQAFPSALFPLAKWLARNPAPDVTQRIRGIVLSSESVYPFQLQTFRSVFACPVVRAYGHTERVLLASTMPDDERYFFWPLYGHLELVDAAGQPVTEPGVLGELVGTSFDNLVMPFVRYRTGDMGAWSAAGEHPALPGFPVLERIEGRLQEFVVCHDRRLVTVTTLGAAHFADLATVDSIQYEQHRPGHLTLKVVSDTELAPDRRAAISAAVRAKTQGGCEVEVVRVARIDRTSRAKLQMLVQHLDLSGFLGAASTEPVPAVTGGLAAGRPQDLPRRHRVLMMGTDPAGRGGIASVVSAYREAGLFDRFVLDYVISHAEGTRLQKVGTAVRAGWAVLRALAARDVAVLHAHVSSRGSFARKSVFLALARRMGVQTVFHLHAGGFHRFYCNAGALTQWWIRRTLERSSLVLCLSESTQSTLRGLAPGARLEVLRNAVCVPPANPTEPDGHRLLFLGLIGEQKGVFVLTEALGRLKAQGLALTLAVGGIGDSAALQRSADERGVGPQLQLLGWIDADRRAQELARAGVFVLPSFEEGLPISLLEAMAAALAVVSTSVGGIPELVTDGVDGLLVKPGDAAALAEALGRLAGDAPLRRRLGQAARQKVVQQFAVNVAVDSLAQLYTSLGARPRRDSA